MKILLYCVCLVFLFSFGHRSFPIMRQKQSVVQFKAEFYYNSGNGTYYVYYDCDTCMTNKYKNGSTDFIGCSSHFVTTTYYCKKTLTNFSNNDGSITLFGTHYSSNNCSGASLAGTIYFAYTTSLTDFNNSCKTTPW